MLDYSAVVGLTHSWHDIDHGQDQEAIRVCFCVLAESIAEAKEKSKKIVENWIESKWPELSGMPEDWSSCYWCSVDSVEIGIGSHPIVL